MPFNPSPESWAKLTSNPYPGIAWPKLPANSHPHPHPAGTRYTPHTHECPDDSHGAECPSKRSLSTWPMFPAYPDVAQAEAQAQADVEPTPSLWVG